MTCVGDSPEQSDELVWRTVEILDDYTQEFCNAASKVMRLLDRHFSLVFARCDSLSRLYCLRKTTIRY